MIESNMIELDSFSLGQIEDMNGFETYEYYDVFQYETNAYLLDDEA